VAECSSYGGKVGGCRLLGYRLLGCRKIVALRVFHLVPKLQLGNPIALEAPASEKQAGTK